jgi:CheY-like chemotaxis protein
MTKDTHKHKILIVEDDPDLAEVYTTLLRQDDYSVALARNGEEALKQSDMLSPDLILLDLRMPVMNGVEFLKKYNLHTEHPDVKVIVFSNYDLQDEIDDAFRMGASRYVLKAWASPKELLQIVEDTLSVN